MVLQKQTVAIPFAQGVDTKTADMHVDVGKLLDLQNGEFDRAGAVNKRNGFAQRANQTHDSGTTVSPDMIWRDGDRIIGWESDGAFAYDADADAWGDLDTGSSTGILDAALSVVDVSPHGPVTATLTFPKLWADCAVNSGYVIIVWMNSTYLVPVLYDVSSNSFIKTNISLNGPAKARAISFGNYLAVVYETANNLWILAADVTSDPTTLASAVNLKSDLNASDNVWDIYYDSTNSAAVGVYKDTSDDMYMFKFDQTGTTSTSAAVAVNTNTNYCSLTSESGVGKAYLYNGSAVQAFGFNVSDLSSAHGLATVETVAGVTKVIGGDDDTKVYYEVPDTTDYYKTDIRRADVDNSGTVSGVASWTTGNFLIGRPTTFNSTKFVPVQGLADLQRRYHLLQEDSTKKGPIATFLSGFGFSNASYNTNGLKINGNIVSSGNNAYMAIPTITGTLQGLDVPVYGVSLLAFDKANPYKYMGQEASLGGVTFFANGNSYIVDGVSLVDYGFHLAPEELTLTAVNGSGSLTADGVYQVKAIYVWYDSHGNRYQSAPSAAFSVTLSGAEDTIEVDVPTFRDSKKLTSVHVEVYRTVAGGSVYYLDAVGGNDPGSGEDQQIDCVTSDANIVSNRFLYTTGGILENRTPDLGKSAVALKDRIFLITGDNKVSYSKKKVRGLGIEFADELTTTVDDRYGKLTALGAHHGRLVMFAERGIFYIDGDGPNAAGQGSFTSPRDIISPVGALDYSPVQTTSLGSFFVSSRGIELLTGAMTVEYIGAAVENSYSGNIVSIVSVPNHNEVRFYADSGDGLTFNYLYNQWGTFSGLTCDRARAIGNNVSILTTGNRLWQEDSSLYQDNSSDYPLLIDTSWIKVAANQGWQRIYWVSLVGEYGSNHTFQVQVFHDYSETATETVTLAVTSDLDPQQLRFKPSVQKCQSIRFRVEDTSPSGTSQAFSLSHLQLEVGVKGGTIRLPAAQTG